MQTTVRKRGRELIWDNVGTHAQVGAINVGFAAWRGAILGSINVLMLPGQMGCIGGAARLCKFDPEPGHDHLPRLGRGGQPGRRLRDRDGDLARQRAGLEDDAGLERRDDAQAERGHPDGAQWPLPLRRRRSTSAATTTSAAWATTCWAAAAAAWNRDGEFANGHFWIPEGRGPNVEAYEADWPILYLFRREHADSGGAGRFRAGNGGEIAYVPHKGESFLGLYTNEGDPEDARPLRRRPGDRSWSRG